MESRFKEYDGDKDKLGELQREYKDITDRIEQLLNAGEISEYIKCTIMDMSNKVLILISIVFFKTALMRKDIKWNQEQQPFLKDLIYAVLLRFHNRDRITDRAAGCDDLYLHPVWCRIITSQEQYRRIR